MRVGFAVTATLLVLFAFWFYLPSECEDYYKILNVAPAADASEIRKAWRRESLTFHPDKYRGRSVSRWAATKWKLMTRFSWGDEEEAFLRITRAYEVLSDTGGLKTQHDDNLSMCRKNKAIHRRKKIDYFLLLLYGMKRLDPLKVFVIALFLPSFCSIITYFFHLPWRILAIITGVNRFQRIKRDIGLKNARKRQEARLLALKSKKGAP